MGISPSRSPRLRFGVFDLDPTSGEMRKRGVRIKLQPQPFKVLALLARRAGKVVTREEIRQTIWGGETFVDFEHGLNFCIHQIRLALNDDADRPRYLETLPRRGYRFIAPLEELAEPPSAVARQKVMAAVLPFEDLGGDRKQEYLADGLTEEMITQLGRLEPERLGVIARTSAMKYKHTDKSIAEIGRELRVDYVLEGSVRRAGQRVRVSAQLIQVSDQTHLWAESYERDLRDILAFQSDVACEIASEIEMKLTPQVEARLARRGPIDPEACEAYLKGRYFFNQRAEESLKKAIEYFRQVITRNPKYAPAYVGLADSYSMLGVWGPPPPKEAFPQAKAAAKRALDIDRGLSDAHSSLAFIEFTYDWRWAAAERRFKRAIELNPSDVAAHYWYAHYLMSMGRQEEAMAEMKRAHELDPLSLPINTEIGFPLYYARRYDEAIEQCRKALEMDPNFFWAHWLLGLAYQQKGSFTEAMDEFHAAVDLSGGSPLPLGALGHACAVCGEKARAEQVLGQLKTLAEKRYVPSCYFALVYGGLGAKEEMFRWMQKAYEDRDGFLALGCLKVEPRLDPLRPDTSFQDFLRRMNFPQ